jgi:hypothetical protein
MESGLKDSVKNEEVLHGVNEERSILHRIREKEGKLTGLRRNCLLKNVNEGQIGGRAQVVGRRERRHRQLPKDLNKTRG